jgi:PAS domain S-box-containing protein
MTRDKNPSQRKKRQCGKHDENENPHAVHHNDSLPEMILFLDSTHSILDPSMDHKNSCTFRIDVLSVLGSICIVRLRIQVVCEIAGFMILKRTGGEHMNSDWMNEFSGAITISDADGIILYMNEKAIKTFEKYGGRSLIGKSLLDVHPEPSRTKVARMFETRTENTYTIEKNGIKKLIHQSPWYRENEFMGFVELSIEIPFDMPHYIRP